MESWPLAAGSFGDSKNRESNNARREVRIVLGHRRLCASPTNGERADTEGFYSMLLNDHFFSPFRPAREPQLECFTTLSAIAAVTTRIRVGSLVAAVAFRSPPLLAKIASTLDHVSNGRLVLGLGVGLEALGVRCPQLSVPFQRRAPRSARRRNQGDQGDVDPGGADLSRTAISRSTRPTTIHGRCRSRIRQSCSAGPEASCSKSPPPRPIS